MEKYLLLAFVAVLSWSCSLSAVSIKDSPHPEVQSNDFHPMPGIANDNGGAEAEVLPDTASESNMNEREKREKAIRAFRPKDSMKSDAEMNAYLDEVKSVLKKRNEKATVKLSERNTNKDVIRNLKYDEIARTRKSINELNKDLLDYLLEGDIAITPKTLAVLDASLTARKKRKTTSDETRKWPIASQGVIPFKLDTNLSLVKIAVIRAAIQFWQDNVCLKFQPATAADLKGINFINDSGCWSAIGMDGGFQDISIGDGCEYFGTVTHEIGHSLGFWHEQSRYDRDSFVIINTQYIKDGEQHNFEEATKKEMSPFTTPYDYGSVMHYRSDAFTNKAGYSTISAKDGKYQQSMGQDKGPSFYDVREMNMFYNCNAACASSNTVCQNGGYPDPKDCAKCKCPLSFSGQLCETIAPAENANCGGVLTASKTMQFLNLTLRSDATHTPHTCYWHIKSEVGTAVEVTVIEIYGSCNAGCFYDFLEVKMGHPTGLINGIDVRSPYEGVGYRFCCKEDNLNVPFVSTTNLVPIIAYTTYYQVFKVQYRQTIQTPTSNSPNAITLSTMSLFLLLLLLAKPFFVA